MSGNRGRSDNKRLLPSQQPAIGKSSTASGRSGAAASAPGSKQRTYAVRSDAQSRDGGGNHEGAVGGSFARALS